MGPIFLYFPLLVTCLAVLVWISSTFLWLLVSFLVVTAVRFATRPRKIIQPFEFTVSTPSKQGDSPEMLFCMHGWPDHARIWDKVTAHFSSSHVCVTYTMPGFDVLGNADSDTFDWGYSFDELVECIALTLRAALKKQGKSSCVLMTHDWGAVLGLMLQHKYPELVTKMVMHDVQLSFFDSSNHTYRVPFILAIGVLYQWWLATAFLISSIPALGPPIGNSMTRFMAGSPFGQGATFCVQGAVLPVSRCRAAMNYPYFYFQLFFFSEWLGLLQDYNHRHSIPKRDPFPSCPTLFCWVIPIFHSKDFEQHLRDRKDCDVLKVKSKTHWYIYEAPESVLLQLDEWLRSGKKHADHQEHYKHACQGYPCH